MAGIRKSHEEHHHSHNDVRDYLLAALEIVEEMNVPDDLRPAALAQAVQLLAAKQIWYEQVQSHLAIPRERLHG